MRYAVVGLCIALSIVATTALGRETQPVPSGGDVVMHYYPPAAAEMGIEGIGVVCCTVRADGSLSCAVPYEWPAGHGFAQATLSVSGHFRLPPSTQVRGGEQVRRVIQWVLPDSPEPPEPDFLEALAVARAVTCEPSDAVPIG